MGSTSHSHGPSSAAPAGAKGAPASVAKPAAAAAAVAVPAAGAKAAAGMAALPGALPGRSAYEQPFLKDADGGELSFEEVRARHWLQCNTLQPTNAPPAAAPAPVAAEAVSPPPALQLRLAAAAVAPGERRTVSMPDGAAAVGRSLAGALASSNLTQPLEGHTAAMTAPSGAALVPAAAAAQADAGGAAAMAFPEAAASPSTRDAFAMLNASFGAPALAIRPDSLPALAQPQPRQQAQPQVPEALAVPSAGQMGAGSSAAAFDPTVTLSTQAAFDTLNSLFGGGAASAPAAPKPAPSAAAAAAAADVTFCTSDAFGMVNSLFGGGGGMPCAGSLASSPVAADPTVTLATRDAFGAINRMFGAQFAHSAASPPLAAAYSAPGSEPTATISTREAFGAVNRLFSGDVRPSMPAAAAVGSGSQYNEPTMTISTREAFNLVNSVLSRPPEPAGAAGRLPALPKPNRKVSAALACPTLASDAICCCVCTVPKCILRACADEILNWKADAGRRLNLTHKRHLTRSTQSNVAMLNRQRRQSTIMPLYEDTEFIGGASLGGGSGLGGGNTMGPGAAAPPTSGPAAGGFSIYEDTGLLYPAASMDADAPAAAGGMVPYEDTLFGGDLKRAAAGPAGGAAGLAGGAGGGLELYADTEFITKRIRLSAGGSSAPGGGPAMMPSAADGSSFGGGAAASTPAFEIYEDTTCVVPRAAAGAAPSGSFAGSGAPTGRPAASGSVATAPRGGGSLFEVYEDTVCMQKQPPCAAVGGSGAAAAGPSALHPHATVTATAPMHQRQGSCETVTSPAPKALGYRSHSAPAVLSPGGAAALRDDFVVYEDKVEPMRVDSGASWQPAEAVRRLIRISHGLRQCALV